MAYRIAENEDEIAVQREDSIMGHGCSCYRVPVQYTFLEDALSS